MKRRLFSAGRCCALAALCACVPACTSDLPTQSTVSLTVYDADFAQYAPYLNKKGGDLDKQSDGGWRIENNDRTRKAMTDLLAALDLQIRAETSELSTAYLTGQLETIEPSPETRGVMPAVLKRLRHAHRQRDFVASVLQRLDPDALRPGDPTQPKRYPYRQGQPAGADPRLPLPRLCSTDELIEMASRPASIPYCQSKPLVDDVTAFAQP